MIEYSDYLPTPSDAILKSTAHGLTTGDGLVRCAVSSLESPSAVACVRAYYPDLELSFGEIPSPDPRLPYAAVDVLTWEYEQTESSPNLPPPDASFLQTVRLAAEQPFNLKSYSIEAVSVASKYSDLTPCEMIGAMQFPGRPPASDWYWDWMFRCQVLTAMVIGKSVGNSLNDTSHGRHLLDIVHGPVDWMTTASMIASTDIARGSERTEIIHLFLDLVRRPMNPIWYMNVYRPAWRLTRFFNHDRIELAKVVATMNDRIDSEEADDSFPRADG
ncbi:hypothetical protein [Novipirellula sp.]|uniref:hypothetical protein n=1 Tax=Novipirellula sp. TaxID=2795430 RepID=UPI00356926BF